MAHASALSCYYAVVLPLFALLPAVHANIPAAFFFGDSILDTGNGATIPNSTYRLALLPPFGTTHFKRPTGRLSDGRTPTDFIAQRLNLSAPPILFPGSSFATGANFATAGATALSLNTSLTLNLAEQLKLFQDLITHSSKSPTKQAVEKGLYVINFGGNDIVKYVSSAQLQAAYNVSTLSLLIASRIGFLIEELYGVGARKVLLIHIPPVGCAPSIKYNFGMTGPGCVAPVTAIVNSVNAALTSKARGLRKTLPGIDLLLAKQNAVPKFIRNPTKFGFVNGESACCGGGLLNAAIYCTRPNSTVCSDPSKYVFWDFLHSTDRVYNAVVRRIWSGSIASVSPINLSKLSRKP